MDFGGIIQERMIHIMRLSKIGEKEKVAENPFEEIIIEISLKLRKQVAIPKDAQQTSRRNPLRLISTKYYIQIVECQRQRILRVAKQCNLSKYHQ